MTNNLGYFDVFLRRGRDENSVRGLTTAASIWLAAEVGVACGLALWPIVLVACCFGLLILMLEPIERWLKERSS
jgi:putative Mg2+ transporter-C (MgtC) family protein